MGMRYTLQGWSSSRNRVVSVLGLVITAALVVAIVVYAQVVWQRYSAPGFDEVDVAVEEGGLPSVPSSEELTDVQRLEVLKSLESDSTTEISPEDTQAALDSLVPTEPGDELTSDARLQVLNSL